MRSLQHGGPCDHCGRVSSPCWRKGPPDPSRSSGHALLCNACGARWLTKRDLTGYFPGAKAARRADGAPPRPRGPRVGGGALRKRKASGKRYSGDGLLPMKRPTDDGGESRYTPPGGGGSGSGGSGGSGSCALASSPSSSGGRFGPLPPLARTTPPPGASPRLLVGGGGSSSSPPGRLAAPPAGLPALFGAAAIKREGGGAAAAPASPHRRRRKPDTPRQSVLF